MFDQFFITDQKIIEELINTAEIKNSDVVLEIGCGNGNVTKLLTEKAKQVIGIEIDEKFKEDLKKISKLQIIIGDALPILKGGKLKFNKIISSLPSSIIEPLFKLLPELEFEIASFLIPLIFVEKIQNDPVFNSYFNFELIKKVDNESFSPAPKTNWAIVKLIKKPDPKVSGNYVDYIIQYLNKHQEAKLKNALMEAIIQVYKLKGKTLTKNESREIIKKINFGEIDLEASAVFNNDLKSKISNLV